MQGSRAWPNRSEPRCCSAMNAGELARARRVCSNRYGSVRYRFVVLLSVLVRPDCSPPARIAAAVPHRRFVHRGLVDRRGRSRWVFGPVN